jgi:hypothetical protein
MLSNNAAATAGKGENLLHLERARKKGPFPNFPQRGTPLISGLLISVVANGATEARQLEDLLIIVNSSIPHQMPFIRLTSQCV